MIYKGNYALIESYIENVLSQNVLPDQLLFVDSDYSEDLSQRYKTNSKIHYISSKRKIYNEGFNPSFNQAVTYAIEADYQYLVSMTINALPNKEWLKAAILEFGKNQKLGMVSTVNVHMDRNNKIFSCGHYLSPSGALKDIGYNRDKEDVLTFLENEKSNIDQLIWSPCSGSAVYSVEAFKKIACRYGDSIFYQHGFKSNNCCIMGFLFREFGYENTISLNSISRRNVKNSLSHKLKLGCKDKFDSLIFCQEINRIANIYNFWPDNMVEPSISMYLNEERKNFPNKIDKEIILTLSKNVTYRCFSKNNTADYLQAHLTKYSTLEKLRKGK